MGYYLRRAHPKLQVKNPPQAGQGELHMLFAPKERGQGLVEYALILVLVAVVVIVILALLGPAVGNVFSNIVSNI